MKVVPGFACAVVVGLLVACGSNAGAPPCGDTASDPNNCGSCGNVCPASSVCQAGACENVAESLTGLRWELPCTNSGNPCTTTASGASASEVLTANVAGTAGTTYNVTLHFRGVVEPRTYLNLQPGGAEGDEADGGANPQYFVESATTPSLDDPENIYALTIADPPQTYYVNSGDSSTHCVTPIDFVATVPMTSGTLVTLTANPVDGLEWSNEDVNGNPVIVSGVPPYPTAYDGQFVQMDVTEVAAAK